MSIFHEHTHYDLWPQQKIWRDWSIDAHTQERYITLHRSHQYITLALQTLFDLNEYVLRINIGQDIDHSSFIVPEATFRWLTRPSIDFKHRDLPECTNDTQNERFYDCNNTIQGSVKSARSTAAAFDAGMSYTTLDRIQPWNWQQPRTSPSRHK